MIVYQDNCRKEPSMNKTKASNTDIRKIAAHAKVTFNVNTEISIPKLKAFKAITGSSQTRGTYNYFQDRVFVNRDIARLLAYPFLEWMIFHEYGHAHFARIFARNSFFPMIIYSPTVMDDIIEHGIRHMWNGLCDCFVNHLVLKKTGAKKFDPLLEDTIDEITKKLAYGMCFHLYDYWKHGTNEQVAQKAKGKIPTEFLDILQSKLSMASINNPIDQIISLLDFSGSYLFEIRVSKDTMSKREIEKERGASLPKFWGDPNADLELIKIT